MARTLSVVLAWLTEWWDDVELWLAQLWYPFQITVVLAVLLPACWAVAWLIDRVVDRASARLTPVRDVEPPLGGRYDEPPATTPRGGAVAPEARP
ncbi:hypothetical protein SAMN05444320_103615 [Streptoalloteichus hindustanus]|uniref:Uncharacterized protein n=1 Tax=Streptoalloteichus hindustanus TaxID=2017 RepID=A0A1M5BKS1_STRHI|nr:hypothetical protein SAMN05444320_103615 [Streptoalloteichus hindustanus]